MKNLTDSIRSNFTIKDALMKMKDENKKYLLITSEDGTYYRVLSWKQIFDFYLNKVDLDTPLNKVVEKSNNQFISEKEDIQESHFSQNQYIVKQNNHHLEIITKTDYLNTVVKEIKNKLEDTFQFKGSEANHGVLHSLHQLIEQYELFHKTLEQIPFTIFISNDKGRVVYFNEKFKKIAGLETEEILGEELANIERLNLYWPPITPIILEEKRPVSIIQQIVKTRIQTAVTGFPIFDKNNNMKWIASISRELQKNELPTNGTLTSIHEVKNNKLLFKNKEMNDIVNLTKQIATVNSTVLITGESGVGKDAIAELIHEQSNRKEQPYIHLNCGAIPESLLESELFGYETGAFSGANKEGKKGLIEAADQGTLYLDEIGEMPLNLQVKFLQVLQNKRITRVGGTKPTDIDVRIIAATNQNLKELVEEGSFRLDLFYRLNVIPIHIPPLRERKEDILPLAYLFLEDYTKKYKKDLMPTIDFEKDLLNYSWPGNIRELNNLIERLVVTSKGRFINHNDLKVNLSDHPFTSSDVNNSNEETQSVMVYDIIPLKQALENVEEKLINMAYSKTKNSYKLAELLGISQSSAHRKIQKYVDH